MYQARSLARVSMYVCVIRVCLSQHQIDGISSFSQNHSAEKLDLYNKVSIFSVCIIFPFVVRVTIHSNDNDDDGNSQRDWVSERNFCCHSQQLAFEWSVPVWFVCMLVGKTKHLPPENLPPSPPSHHLCDICEHKLGIKLIHKQANIVPQVIDVGIRKQGIQSINQTINTVSKSIFHILFAKIGFLCTRWILIVDIQRQLPVRVNQPLSLRNPKIHILN